MSAPPRSQIWQLHEITRPAWSGAWTLEDLLFDPEAHIYTHGPTSQRLLNVTGVMGDNGLGFDPTCIGARALLQARERGLYVHQTVALSILGRLDRVRFEAERPELVGYLVSYEKRRQAEGLHAITVEPRFYSPTWWYAGTADQVGMARGGRRLGVELKSGDDTDVDIQAGAYNQLWNIWRPLSPIDEWQRWRLFEDGRPAAIAALDVSQGWLDFASALRMTLRRAALGRSTLQ